MNGTDKLEYKYVVNKLGCDYVVDDVSGESFTKNGPEAKQVIVSLPKEWQNNG